MTSYNAQELPVEVREVLPHDEELRCPHYVPKKRGICNKLLCRGRASMEPQEFLCRSCGNKTIFRRIG